MFLYRSEMKFNYLILTTFFFLFYGTVRAQVPKNLISQTAGLVGDTVITTRKFKLIIFLSRLLIQNKKSSYIDVEDSKFKSFVTGVVLEWVVYKEAIALQYGVVDEKEIDKMVKQVRLKLAGIKPWQNFKRQTKRSDPTWSEKYERKLLFNLKQTLQLFPLRTQRLCSTTNKIVPRFGSLEFAQFKDRIIKFLTRQQVDQRLKKLVPGSAPKV